MTRITITKSSGADPLQMLGCDNRVIDFRLGKLVAFSFPTDNSIDPSVKRFTLFFDEISKISFFFFLSAHRSWTQVCFSFSFVYEKFYRATRGKRGFRMETNISACRILVRCGERLWSVEMFVQLVAVN